MCKVNPRNTPTMKPFRRSQQFLLFLGVGLLAALINFFTRMLFSLVVSFPVAVGLAYLVGLSVAFLLNRYTVFPHSQRPIHNQALEFVATNLAFLPVVLVASSLLSDMLMALDSRIPSQAIAHLISLGFPAVLTYLIYKYRVFREVSR